MAEDERERREWLSRRELLRRAGLGTAVLRTAARPRRRPFAGAPKFRHKELQHTLRIIQWVHFVPAYDTWLLNTYTKVWGGRTTPRSSSITSPHGPPGSGGLRSCGPGAATTSSTSFSDRRLRGPGHQPRRRPRRRRRSSGSKWGSRGARPTTRRRRSTSASPTTTCPTRSSPAGLVEQAGHRRRPGTRSWPGRRS